MTNSADPDQMASEANWSVKKPTDLDLYFLLRQGMSCSARGGLRVTMGLVMQKCVFRHMQTAKAEISLSIHV